MFPLIKSPASELPGEFHGTSVDSNEGSVGIQRNSWDNFYRMEACHFEFMQCEAINTLTTAFLQVQHSDPNIRQLRFNSGRIHLLIEFSRLCRSPGLWLCLTVLATETLKWCAVINLRISKNKPTTHFW